MLVHSKKVLPSLFSLVRNRIYSGTHLKEELTDLFWKPTGYGIPLFPHTGREDRGC